MNFIASVYLSSVNLWPIKLQRSTYIQVVFKWVLLKYTHMVYFVHCNVHLTTFVTILYALHLYEETLKNEKIDYFCIIAVLGKR